MGESKEGSSDRVIEHDSLSLWDKMVFERAIIKPPHALPNLMHNEACFMYLLKGSSRTFTENSVHELGAKDAVLMRCGNFVAHLMPSGDSEVYEALAVHFHPDVLRKAYGNEIPQVLRQQPHKAPQLARVKTDQMLEKYIESLLFYFQNQALVTEELLVLKLKELLLLLANNDSAPEIRQILSNLFSPTPIEFHKVVETHLYSPISVNELATLTNMSLSSFKREFNKYYGESPANYLRNKKIERASQLLQSSDLPISHIAWDCGFQDVAHFARVFRKYNGCSATEFRAQKN